MGRVAVESQIRRTIRFLIVGTIMACALAAASCDCEDIVHKRSRNRAHGYDAIVFDRRCGPPGDPGRIVVIAPLDAPPSAGMEEGLVLTIDNNNVNLRDSPEVLEVDVEWVSNDTLRVVYDARARVFQERASVLDVVVDFETR